MKLLYGHDAHSPIQKVSISSVTNMMVYATETSFVIFRLSSHTILRSFDMLPELSIHTISWAPSGRYVAVGFSNGILVVFDMEQLEHIKLFCERACIKSPPLTPIIPFLSTQSSKILYFSYSLPFQIPISHCLWFLSDIPYTLLKPINNLLQSSIFSKSDTLDIWRQSASRKDYSGKLPFLLVANLDGSVSLIIDGIWEVGHGSLFEEYSIPWRDINYSIVDPISGVWWLYSKSLTSPLTHYLVHLGEWFRHAVSYQMMQCVILQLLCARSCQVFSDSYREWIALTERFRSLVPFSEPPHRSIFNVLWFSPTPSSLTPEMRHRVLSLPIRRLFELAEDMMNYVNNVPKNLTDSCLIHLDEMTSRVHNGIINECHEELINGEGSGTWKLNSGIYQDVDTVGINFRLRDAVSQARRDVVLFLDAVHADARRIVDMVRWLRMWHHRLLGENVIKESDALSIEWSQRVYRTVLNTPLSKSQYLGVLDTLERWRQSCEVIGKENTKSNYKAFVSASLEKGGESEEPESHKNLGGRKRSHKLMYWVKWTWDRRERHFGWDGARRVTKLFHLYHLLLGLSEWKCRTIQESNLVSYSCCPQDDYKIPTYPTQCSQKEVGMATNESEETLEASSSIIPVWSGEWFSQNIVYTKSYKQKHAAHYGASIAVFHRKDDESDVHASKKVSICWNWFSSSLEASSIPKTSPSSSWCCNKSLGTMLGVFAIDQARCLVLWYKISSEEIFTNVLRIHLCTIAPPSLNATVDGIFPRQTCLPFYMMDDDENELCLHIENALSEEFNTECNPTLLHSLLTVSINSKKNFAVVAIAKRFFVLDIS